MVDIQVYMSPVEPPVITSTALSGTSTDTEEDAIIINLVPKNQSSIEVTVPMLNVNDNYVMAL